MPEPPPHGDEAWLVLRVQAGSREHLERLVVAAQGFLAPRLRPMFKQPADAEDVLQEVLFTICRRLWTLNDPRLFRPWAHRIAVRAAWKSLRRLHREHDRNAPLDPEALPVAEPDDSFDLLGQLSSVSPASRIVLILHYIEGMTIEETAAELGVAPGTVKSRLAYGLKQLRDHARPLEADR